MPSAGGISGAAHRTQWQPYLSNCDRTIELFTIKCVICRHLPGL
ncbi:hypothetical protein [Nostoc sp.]